jgi:parallel beta-helix repeat protein
MKKFFLLVCFFLLFFGVSRADVFHIDNTGGDCPSIGVWDAPSQTCTLSAPLSGLVVIDSDGITLDGANLGLATTSDPTINQHAAVLIFQHQNDTIKNLTVSAGGDGVHVEQATSTTLDNVTSIGSTNGFLVAGSENVTIENCTVKDPVASGLYAYFDIKNLTLRNNHFSESLPDDGLSTHDNIFLYFPMDQNNQPENISIDQSNTVDGRTVYYFENQNGADFENLPNAGVFYCVNCQNITLASTTFDGGHNKSQINLYETTGSKIENNIVKNGRNYGLYLNNSDGNDIEGNNFSSDQTSVGSMISSQNIYRGNTFDSTGYPDPGIELNGQSVGNLVTENNFQDTGGIDVIGGSSSIIVQNNFFDGYGDRNIWQYSGIGTATIAQNLPVGGNYYQLYHLPSQGCSDLNNDGLCDTAYDVPTAYGATETIDAYPWTTPNGWQNYKGATTTDNVLFLPGIEASRLYQTNSGGVEQRKWEPWNDSDVRDIELGENGEPLSGDKIYTRDVIDQAYKDHLDLIGPNIYKSFLAELAQMKSDGTIADYSAVAYDWRLSLDDILNGGTVSGSGDSEQISYTNATTSPYIISELRRLVASSKSGKVTIVAHSNGGLLTKALMVRLAQTDPDLLAKIDKVIFVAVPQLGTPEAIAALLHGSEQAIPYDWLPLLISQHAAREFAHNSPMAYNLLPSADYFTYVDTPVVTFDSTLPDWQAKYGSADKNADGTNGKYFGMIHSEELLDNFLTDNFGRVSYDGADSSDINNPVSLSPSLLSAANAEHILLDSWTAPTTTQIFEIAGWGVPSTMSGVTYTLGQKSDCIGDICTSSPYGIELEPNWTIDGDGVVVTPSALWMGQENVKRYWVDLKDYNNDHPVQTLKGFFPFDHKKILEVGELDTFIQQIITNQVNILPQYISDKQPMAGANDTRLIFALTSDSLDIYDDAGDHTGISTSTGELEENIPGTSEVQVGGTVYVFSTASSTNKIIITTNPTQIQNDNQNGDTNNVSTTSSATTKKVKRIKLKIEKISGDDTVMASTTFEIITDSASTTAEMTVTGNDISSSSPLVVDMNGDGQNIVTLTPKIDDTVEFVDADISTSTATTTETTDQDQATTTGAGGVASGAGSQLDTGDDSSGVSATTTPADSNFGTETNGPIVVAVSQISNNNLTFNLQNPPPLNQPATLSPEIKTTVNPPEIQQIFSPATSSPVSVISGFSSSQNKLLANVLSSGASSYFQTDSSGKSALGIFILFLLFVILYKFIN